MPRGYPHEPKTLGEHVKRRRLELGLRQRIAAERLGVGERTLAAWERGLRQPLARNHGRIVGFLGFDPVPPADGLLARLNAARRRHGLTVVGFAERTDFSEWSLRHWLNGSRAPSQWMRGRLQATLDRLEGRSDGTPAAEGSFFELTRRRRAVPPGIAPTTLGERLRARRIELGLSQAEVGARLGVRRGTIYHWERGDATPSAEHEVQLRRFLLS